MENAVLITGASSGFGKEFARIFAQKGNNVLLVARRSDVLENMKKELEADFGIKAFVLAMDLSSDDAADQVFSFTKKLDLNIETLVNNAGYGDWSEFASADMEKLNSMVHLNALTLLKLCRLYAPLMKEKGRGYILNVASIAAFSAGPLMGTYYASKAFVLSLSESLHEELKKSGVCVTALCPGPANTGFTKLAALDGTAFAHAFTKTSAKSVAEYGYKKLIKNKAIAVPGLTAKFMHFFLKILPRSLTRKAIYAIQKK